MKVVIAFWYGSQGFFGLVLGQTNWASAIIGLGKSPAFTEHSCWVGLYGGPIEAHYDYHRLWSPVRELSFNLALLIVFLDPATSVT